MREEDVELKWSKDLEPLVDTKRPKLHCTLTRLKHRRYCEDKNSNELIVLEGETTTILAKLVQSKVCVDTSGQNGQKGMTSLMLAISFGYVGVYFCRSIENPHTRVRSDYKHPFVAKTHQDLQENLPFAAVTLFIDGFIRVHNKTSTRGVYMTLYVLKLFS